MKTSPTRVFNPFPNVKVRLFGRNSGNKTDWSITPLTDEARQVGGTMPDCYDLVAAQLYEADVHTAYAPRPSMFNAEIVDHGELKTFHQPNFDTHVEDELFPWRRSVGIFRGVDADGCDIPSGCAFWLSSADCSCIVARAKSGFTIAAHAGRDSLVDRKCLETDTPSRRHASVVDAIMARFKENGDLTADLKFFLTCGIRADAFRHRSDHPRFGQSNRKLIEHLRLLDPMCVLGDPCEGRISLNAVVIAQLGRHGVSMSQITDDNIDTFADKGLGGEYTWWSNARATTLEEKAKRNGVMVINRR